MISDGMGTGNEANKESKKMIEVMEDMLGAGIEEEVCIQLLDSIIAFETEKEKYAKKKSLKDFLKTFLL